MRTILLAAARDDMDDIWRFGAREWSKERADDYFMMLSEAIQRLADNPKAAQSAELARPGYRRLVVGSHAVFYRVTNDAVEVLRILHQSRDAGIWVG